MRMMTERQIAALSVLAVAQEIAAIAGGRDLYAESGDAAGIEDPVSAGAWFQFFDGGSESMRTV